jgi:hypothetical protein
MYLDRIHYGSSNDYGLYIVLRNKFEIDFL